MVSLKMANYFSFLCRAFGGTSLCIQLWYRDTIANCQKKKNLASWLLIPGRELLYLSLKLSYGLVGWWFHDSIFAYADKKKKLCSDRGQTLNSSSPHLITDYTFTLLISLVICCVVCACVWWVGGWVGGWVNLGVRCGYWISSTKRCRARGLPIRAFQRETWPPATLILPRSALQ